MGRESTSHEDDGEKGALVRSMTGTSRQLYS